MSFNRLVFISLFIFLTTFQLACSKDSDESAATPGKGSFESSVALTVLPSSAVTVAEKNQVISYNPDGNKGWAFTLPDNDTVAARPAAALSSTTYIRGAQGLYAIAPDGKLMWQAKHMGAGDSIKGITALSDSTVGITVGDNSLVGFNAQGQTKWTFKMPEGEKITASPTLAASSIVYMRSETKIYAIDSQGNLAWVADIGESAKK